MPGRDHKQHVDVMPRLVEASNVSSAVIIFAVPNLLIICMCQGPSC